MLGEITPEEIDEMLRSEAIGRIGCYAFGRPYVVPITFAYDGVAVYGHSREGLKLRMMRSHPSVCFEVDEIPRPEVLGAIQHGDVAPEHVLCLAMRMHPWTAWWQLTHARVTRRLFTPGLGCPVLLGGQFWTPLVAELSPGWQLNAPAAP